MAKRRKTNKSVTQQVKSVNDRYKGRVKKVVDHQERVVTAMLIPLQSKAEFYTPQDTNALINSQYRRVRREGNNIIGRVGYTQDYAAALHGIQGMGIPSWAPRPPNTPGKKGGGYNPNAVPYFLQRGARESIDEMFEVAVKLNKGHIK